MHGRHWVIIHMSLCHFFRHRLKIDTEYLMYHHMEILSGVTPVFYDTCNNSCCLFVVGLSGHRECPICNAPCFHKKWQSNHTMAIPPENTQVQGLVPILTHDQKTQIPWYTPLVRLLMSLMVPITELFSKLI